MFEACCGVVFMFGLIFSVGGWLVNKVRQSKRAEKQRASDRPRRVLPPQRQRRSRTHEIEWIPTAEEVSDYDEYDDEYDYAEEEDLELELATKPVKKQPPSILAFFVILFGVGTIMLGVFAIGIPDWPIEQCIILVYLIAGEKLPGGRFIADHTRSLQNYYEDRRWRAGCLGLMVYMIPYVNFFFLGKPFILALWAVILALPLEFFGALITFYVLPIPQYGMVAEYGWDFWTTFFFEVFLSIGIAPFLVMLALHVRWRIY